MPNRIGEFDSTREDISSYLFRLNNFFLTKAETRGGDAEVLNLKRAWLFRMAGTAAVRVLQDLCSPELPDVKMYTELCALLVQHYKPHRDVKYQRKVFSQRKQNASETYQEYALALRHQASLCEFGAFLDEAMKTQFFNNIASSVFRDKISEVAGNFQALVDAASRHESPDHHAVGEVHAINPAKSKNRGSRGSSSGPKHFVKPGPPSPPRKQPSGSTPGACNSCGGNHPRSSCRFRDAECYTCKRKGHLARVCGKVNISGRNRAVHHVDVPGAHGGVPASPSLSRGDSTPHSSSSRLPDYSHTLFRIEEGDGEPVTPVSVRIEGIPFDMMLDTGAPTSIIGEPLYIEHFRHLPLQSTTPLDHCDSGGLNVLGKINVLVEYADQRAKLPLVVIRGRRSGGTFAALFGRKWVRAFRMPWTTLYPDPTVNFLTPASVLQEMKKCFPNVFSAVPGTIRGFEANVRLVKDAVPVFLAPRVIPVPLRERVRVALDKMESDGLIQKCLGGAWGTPIVVVKKADGGVRVCGDFSVTVNPQLDMNHYPLPLIDDLSLLRGKFYCKLDLAQAYLQLKVGPSSQDILVLSTPFGTYKCLRLMYGLASAPAIFQSVMMQMLAGIQGMFIYLDDILLTADTEDELRLLLRQVLERMDKHGVTLREDKCLFMVPRIRYLGFELDASGLHPDQTKITAITEAPTPTNIAELRAFIGLVNFYHKFLPDAATRMNALNALLCQDKPWCWGPEQAAAFEYCKTAMTSDKVLVPYSLQQKLRLTCDASPVGAGCMLAHVDDQGIERPVAFASKTFSASEKNYAQVEREAAAVMFGVKHFHKYLCGREFELCTDNSPLSVIFSPKSKVRAMTAARLQRWAILLSGYRYTISHKKAAAVQHADALSRILPLPNTTEVEQAIYSVEPSSMPLAADQVATETQADPLYTKVYYFTLHGWPEHTEDPELQPFLKMRMEFSLNSGCVLRGHRAVVPTKLHAPVLHLLHELHPGITRMKALARDSVWWPTLDCDIETLVGTCGVCQSLHVASPESQLTPWTWPTRRWERIHVDLAEKNGQKFLIVQDAHSKWPEVLLVDRTTAVVVCGKLMSLFATWGYPEELVSDNGPPFSSAEFDDFLRDVGCVHTTSPIYHPQSNGAAERAVRSFKDNLLKQMLDDRTKGRPLQGKIDAYLLSYRNTPHTLTKVTPPELFLGRKPRTKLSLLHPSSLLKKQIRSRQEEQIAAQARKTPQAFTPGDLVWVRSVTHRVLKWLPGVILAQASSTSYEVDLLSKGVKHVARDFLRTRHPQANIPQGDPELPQPTIPRRVPELPVPVPDAPVPAMSPREPAGLLPRTPMATPLRAVVNTASRTPLTDEVSQLRDPVPIPRGGTPQEPASAATPRVTSKGRVIREPSRFKDYVT